MHENLWLQRWIKGRQGKNWTSERNYWTLVNALRLEKCCRCHYTKLGTCHANDWKKYLPSSSKCQKEQFELCGNWHGVRRRNGPCLAPSSRRIRILLIACYQWVSRSSLAEGLHHAVICAGVSGFVAYWRIGWAWLSEKHFAQALRKIGSEKEDDKKGYERMLLHIDSWIT